MVVCVGKADDNELHEKSAHRMLESAMNAGYGKATTVALADILNSLCTGAFPAKIGKQHIIPLSVVTRLLCSLSLV